MYAMNSIAAECGGSRAAARSGKTRVAVIFGGCSPEHEVSLQSAAAATADIPIVGTSVTDYKTAGVINENDARRVPFRLIKKIAHAGCAHADKHLNKIRTADAEKRDARFASHGTCQQCFARARRTK